MVSTRTRPAEFGMLLQTWRKRRRLSQLELSSSSGVSTRHLSFLETGRARASRETLLHLAEHLDVPLRERNHLLMAAGFAPIFPETAIDSAEMEPVRSALEGLLRGHDPYPALVMNRRFELVAANGSIDVLIDGIPDHLLTSPVNTARVALHPEGLARRVVNLAEYRHHILTSVSRASAATGDPELADLYDEVSAYPVPGPAFDEQSDPAVVLPVRLRGVRPGDPDLSFFSIIATFGTPRDVTVAELAIESFFPADPVTEAALRQRAGHRATSN